MNLHPSIMSLMSWKVKRCRVLFSLVRGHDKRWTGVILIYWLSLDYLKLLLIGIQFSGWKSVPRWQQQIGSFGGAKPNLISYFTVSRLPCSHKSLIFYLQAAAPVVKTKQSQLSVLPSALHCNFHWRFYLVIFFSDLLSIHAVFFPMICCLQISFLWGKKMPLTFTISIITNIQKTFPNYY